METTIEVHEASQVGEVRRAAAEMARAEQMSVTETGQVALVVTEAATNLVKYAKSGTVTLSRFAEGSQHGIEIIAIDRGPGLADLAAAFRDGHSTGGGLGVGLGSMQRASAYFDVYTLPGQGTALLARVTRAAPRSSLGREAAPALLASGRSVPLKGQVECGDAWRVRDFGARQWICIVDGLGHGPLAAVAAKRAIQSFDSAPPGALPADIVQSAHEDLKGTRGAVMAVLALDSRAGTAVFCGVGNINAAIFHEASSEHLLSIDGIVGYNVRKVRSQQVAWKPNALVILNTDGLSRWSLGKYPGLAGRHPSLIASVLFRDHARDTDDATVVVARGM
jgi:anti-sigma regulatory factor (Ser/Thr protein kinase)